MGRQRGCGFVSLIFKKQIRETFGIGRVYEPRQLLDGWVRRVVFLVVCRYGHMAVSFYIKLYSTYDMPSIAFVKC